MKAILLLLFVMPFAVVAQSNRTITIGDLTNDYNGTTEYLGSEAGRFGHLVWNATNLYIGITGNPMVTTNSNVYVVIDLDPVLNADPRTGNGRSDQPTNESGGATYPFNADIIYRFFSTASDDVSIQNQAPGERYVVSAGNWTNAPIPSGVRIYRRNTTITDFEIPFADMGIPAGANFNVIIYVANTSTSGSIFAQWPTGNADGTNPILKDFYSFNRTTGVTTNGGIHYSVRETSSGYSIGANTLGRLYFVPSSSQAYFCNALLNAKSMYIGSNAIFSQGNNTAALTVNESFINAGTYTMSSNIGGDLVLGGDFVQNGTFTHNNRALTFNGTALQTITSNTTLIVPFVTINNAANVNLNNNLEITGSLVLTTGTLNIAGNLLDLNGASLVSTSGFLNGSNTSDFTVRGSTGGTVTIPQSGNISLETVTIADTRTVAMNGVNDINLYGALTIASGSTYDNGGESQITNLGGTITINGKFITRDANGFNGSSTAIPTITPILNTGCTIEYGRFGDQDVQGSTSPNYKNVTFSGSGIKRLLSSTTSNHPVGTVYITGSAIFNQVNFNFGDATTNLTMDGGRYRLSGTGTKPNIDGAYVVTGGIIEFYNIAGTAQTIRGTNNASVSIIYNAIEINGSNVAQSNANINLRANGTFTIKNGGIFTNNARAIVANPANNNQTLTIETGGKFITGNDLGFYGSVSGLNSPSVRDNIPNVVLQNNSTIEYSGTTTQNFTTISTSPVTNYKNVIISGGGEKILTGAVTIDEILTLTSGLVNTTSTNLLILNSTATCSGGGSTSSFVNGPMRKTGNTDFSFPVGQLVVATPHYRTIGIVFPSSGTGVTTQAFTTQFRRADSYTQGGLTATAITNGLQRASRCEYWDLTRSGVGAENVGVTLSWEAQSRCNVGNYVTALSSLVVVQYNGSAWGDLFGRSSNTGTTSAGTITWSGVLLYNKFTLGSTDASQNPLPFNLSSFTAALKQKTVDLNWKVSNNNEQKEYILERSKGAIQFEVIASISAKANLTVAEYNYTDAQPVNGWNYYRLRATDHQNKTQTSSIIKVWMGRGAFISVMPNPASEKIVINLSELSSILQMQIVNTSGQVLRQLNTIQFLNEINISNLQAGMYYIRFLGKDGVTTKSFIKH